MTDTKLYLSDLMTGVLAGMALRGLASVGRKVLLEGLLRGWPTLVDAARAEALDPVFQLEPHPVYDDCPALEDALRAAGGRGVVVFDAPGCAVIRLPNAEVAREYLRRVPGPPNFYLAGADLIRVGVAPNL